MILSTQQKAIIRSIANAQIESFLRISEKEKVELMMEEMREAGYEVTESEILEQMVAWLEKWDNVIEDPDRFLATLDEVNLNMVRHYLFQEFQGHPDTKLIWRQLNLFDNLNIKQNNPNPPHGRDN